MDKKCIIVDLDGTLFDTSHRLHYIKTKPKNWKEFFAQSVHDPVHEDVYWLIHLFHSTGHQILFVTARPENERDNTIKVLHETAHMEGKYEKLYMRYPGDYRNDDIVKRDILRDIRNEGYDPFLALEDRDHVVSMWRSEGVYCHQVRNENEVGLAWQQHIKG